MPTEPNTTSRVEETLAMVRNALRTLGLVWRVNPRRLVELLACQLTTALTNVAIAYVAKRLVDAVVLASRTPGHPSRGALTWIAVELGLMLLRASVSALQTYGDVALRSELGLEVNLLILEKSANVSYPRFEDPAFVNAMTQARREASSRPLDLVNQTFTFARQMVTLAGYVVLLWALGPWAVLALVASAIPPFWAEARNGREVFLMQRARTQRNRQAFYLESVLTREEPIKEVKLFALARWLIGRFRDVYVSFHHEEIDRARRHARAVWWLTMLSTLVLYGTYALIVMRTVAGAITLGAMTLYLMVFRDGQSSLKSALLAIASMYQDNLFMTNLFEFLAIPDDEPDAPLASDGADLRAPEVRFENVTFRYPESESDALSDVNLTIRAGETVALVGRNGAGKTTFVKLLAGLYRPTRGRILIDGDDIATLAPGELRRRLGVIFQDFVRFQFSAADNVGLGWLPSIGDRTAVERAVADAGAGEVVARLPKGLDTAMGRAFGGDELSGGQWQRIALARAFMRKSRILVLDEPTASMDAEAEHAIFQRFRELKSGRTAVLISHRFSTVRMADRIVVFDGGRIDEVGSHGELMARGGRYARMFEMQAEGYRAG